MPSSKGDESDEERKVSCCEDEEEEDEEIPSLGTPPDGGWGWWVVLSSFLCNMIVDGVCFSFGVVTMEYQKEFGATHSEVGWVGSSLAGCYLLVGPFVSALCARYGCRKVTIIGSVVTMIGFCVSTQSNNLAMLIFTYGVIGGIGFGMIYLPSIVCVGHWFERKRAFTTGIAVCGTGMGQSIFPPLAHHLLTEYNWRGQNLIMAGIVLHCAAFGMTFLPVNRQYFKRQKEMRRRKVGIPKCAIMEALIEVKKRQRTISNGSLDNCIITTDNRLIKLDPKIFELNRNSSFIARFKRQLGFSSQSLESSRSIQRIPSIVMDAVQKDLYKSSAPPIYKPSGIRNRDEFICSNQFGQKRVSLPDGYSSTLSQLGGIPVTKSSLELKSVVKPQGNDHSPSDESPSRAQIHDGGSLFKAPQNGHGVPMARSSSDIESESARPPSVAGSVISIQLTESEAFDSMNCRNIRYRSNQSVNSSYSHQSKVSYVSGSVLSIPQLAAGGEAEEQDHNSFLLKCWQIVCEMIDVKLMLNPVFALLVVSSFVTLLAFFVPFFYLPSKGGIIGMSEGAAAFLLSIVGITNTVGRILCGWLADRPWVDTLHFNNAALIMAGLAILLCPLCNSEGPLAFLAAVFGLCTAVYVSLKSVLLVDLLGLEMLNKSFGLLILFHGMAAFIGAPIAGGLRDATGDVNHCFYLAGSLIILSGVIMLPIVRLRTKTNKSPPETPNEVPFTETLRLEQLESSF